MKNSYSIQYSVLLGSYAGVWFHTAQLPRPARASADAAPSTPGTRRRPSTVPAPSTRFSVSLPLRIHGVGEDWKEADVGVGK